MILRIKWVRYVERMNENEMPKRIMMNKPVVLEDPGQDGWTSKICRDRESKYGLRQRGIAWREVLREADVRIGL